MSTLWERSPARLVCGILLLATLSSTGVTGREWSFIVTGDSRDYNDAVNLTIMPELVNEILNHDVDFVLFSGDLVQGWPVNYVDPADLVGLENQLLLWRNIMQPVYDAGIGVYPVRGNHEVNSYYSGTSLTAWNNVFTGSYALPDNGPEGEINLTYSVTHKNVFILGLGQYVVNRGHLVNQPWIDAQLAANGRRHIFAYGHVPAFKLHSVYDLSDDVDARDAFWTSLEDAGARVYFCADTHLYDHARADDDGDPSNDVHQIVVATAGAPLYTWSPPYQGPNSDWDIYQIYHAEQYGYVLVEMDGVDATFTWMERVDNDTYEATEQWSYTAPGPTTCAEVWSMGYGLQTDLDQSCYVNWGDFSLFASQWLWCNDPLNPEQCSDYYNWIDPIPANCEEVQEYGYRLAADFNQDCYVDWRDFSMFAGTWLDCNDPANIPPCIANW